MSSVARNYSYQVIIEKGKEKEEPTISQGTLMKYKEDIAKYLRIENKNDIQD